MLTDTHCHVLSVEYEDINSIINNLENNNVKRIIVNGYNYQTNLEIIELIQKYDHVYGALGVHPNNLHEGFNESLALIEEYINHPKIVAIGEIGLDFFYTDNRDEQILHFSKLLALAEKYHKPVIIHNRKATAETLATLSNFKLKGVIHCFSGSYETATAFIKLGFKLGINGIVTFKNANLSDVLIKIEPSSVLLETDAPYLTPDPHRKEINEPRYLNQIAEKVAHIYNITVEELAIILEQNLQDVFDI